MLAQKASYKIRSKLIQVIILWDVSIPLQVGLSNMKLVIILKYILVDKISFLPMEIVSNISSNKFCVNFTTYQ